MRGLYDIRRSRPAIAPGVRVGWLSDLAADAVVYRAPRTRWIVISLLLLVGLVPISVVILLYALSTIPIDEGDLLSVALLVLLLGILPLTLVVAGLRTGLHAIARRVTIAVDRSGLRHWRQGLIRWDEMNQFELASNEYLGRSLVIKRRRRPGERTWFGRAARTEISEHVLEVPFTDLLVVMAQFSAAQRNGTPVDPPPPETMTVAAGPADEVALITAQREIAWRGPVYNIGAVLDPAAGIGLHQLELELVLRDRPKVTVFALPEGPLGRATRLAVDTLIGGNGAASRTEPAVRLRRLFSQYAPAVIGFGVLTVGFAVLRGCT